MHLSPLPARTPTRPFLLALAISLSSAAVACSLVAPETERDRTQLERAWRKWTAVGADDYRYVQQRLCYCLHEVTSPVLITVTDGVVANVRYARDNAAVPTQLAAIWGSMDDLFRLVEQAIDEQAHSLLVSYHPTLGFPTHISIDYRQSIVDDELTITASSFVASN